VIQTQEPPGHKVGRFSCFVSWMNQKLLYSTSLFIQFSLKKGESMPRKTDPLKVSQESSKTEDGKTTLAFTITAPDTDWRLQDILASQHIIPNLADDSRGGPEILRLRQRCH
jgi:hypothetical protein